MGLFRPYERTEHTSQAEGTGSKQRRRLVPADTSTRTGATAVKADDRTATTRRPRRTPAPAGAEETAVADPDVSATGPTSRGPRRKEGPTISRAEAEAARMERLHPTLTPKQQRKADRQARMQQRVDTWDKIENTKERRLARDYIDSRWTIAEFMLPVMLIIMAAVMITMPWPVLSTYIGLLLWVLLIAVLVHHFFLWRGFKEELHRRWPDASSKGLGMYMFNRALMIRRFRRPAPEIDRGDELR